MAVVVMAIAGVITIGMVFNQEYLRVESPSQE